MNRRTFLAGASAAALSAIAGCSSSGEHTTVNAVYYNHSDYGIEFGMSVSTDSGGNRIPSLSIKPKKAFKQQAFIGTSGSRDAEPSPVRVETYLGQNDTETHRFEITTFEPDEYSIILWADADFTPHVELVPQDFQAWYTENFSGDPPKVGGY